LSHFGVVFPQPIIVKLTEGSGERERERKKRERERVDRNETWNVCIDVHFP
jgi:hypothetical protein